MNTILRQPIIKLLKTVLYIACLNLMTVSFVEAKTFKIASNAPDGSYWMKKMRAGAKKIKKQTQGRVKFKYYPGGIMGSEGVTLKKIRIGQLQGAAVSGTSLVGFFPDSQIYSLPMIFNSFEEVDFVRESIDKKIIKGLDKAGMVSFGLSEGGFTYAMSTDPINKAEDLMHQKIWAPTNNKQAELTLKSFGVLPIPLNVGDVLAGLQTKLIDTVTVPPILAIALQWHTQIKYIIDIPLTYTYASLVMDKKAFKKIKSEDQKTVRSIMNQVFKDIDEQNRKDNISAFIALKNQGIEIITPKVDVLNEWYERGDAARDSIKSQGTMSHSIYQEINELLNIYRVKKEQLSAAR